MADISQIKLPNNTTYDLSVQAEKIKSGYLSNRIYLSTQPEDGGSAVLPFLYNDLAFLTLKGGSIDAYLTTDTTYTAETLSNRTEYAISSPLNLFDASPSYAGNIVRGGTDAATDIRVIDLTLHKTFTYSNVFYIDFGNAGWRARNIQVLVKNSATETDYVKKIDITANNIGHRFASVSHSSTNSSGTTVQGFNRMRIVLSGFTSGSTTGNTRIAQIGLISFGSAGTRETYMSRGIDDPIYRSITPNTNNTYDLGSSSKKWANGYFTNINGVAVGSSPKFTDNNDTAHYVRTTQVLYKTATVLYRYQICLEVNDTTVVPINTVNNSSGTTNKTLTTSSFKPFGKILYYNNTSTVNANATIPGDRLGYAATINLGYSFNTGTSLTAQKAVYLVCTPQADGTAKLYSTPITQTLPTTEDGRYYIYLGQTYSTSNIYLYENHPVYMYKNGAVREVSQYAENIDPVDLLVAYNTSTETLSLSMGRPRDSVTLASSYIDSGGKIAANSDNDVIAFKVTAGEVIKTISNSHSGGLAYAFYTAIPAVGSTSYNGGRVTSNGVNIVSNVTVPSGCTWIAIRTNHGGTASVV